MCGGAQGSGFGVLGFRVLRVQDLGFREGLGLRVFKGLGLRVEGLGYPSSWNTLYSKDLP